ncbi:hypothetical protein MBOT_21170 [Mycobacterium botniense]|uniref:XRE family transcriptional regulator n=1 Tax=Mycobacterium botniense TaxID=84962 RepID=A0A7I9XY77_9MYCO|nr:hypothetical protein MBOT_21170 [Mycobacterium botniense]
MTTHSAAGKGGEETLTQAVARRLRGQLAELMISRKQFSELTGWDRMYVYRRLRGETAMDTAELEHIERTAGIAAHFLLTGNEPTPSPDPPPGLPNQLKTRRRNRRRVSSRTKDQPTG